MRITISTSFSHFIFIFYNSLWLTHTHPRAMIQFKHSQQLKKLCPFSFMHPYFLHFVWIFFFFFVVKYRILIINLAWFGQFCIVKQTHTHCLFVVPNFQDIRQTYRIVWYKKLLKWNKRDWFYNIHDSGFYDRTPESIN